MGHARGYSLIEFLVATLIFSLVATAVAQTIVLTQRFRGVSANWLRATQLAVQRIEAFRAGVLIDEESESGIFRRETALSDVAGHPGLKRVDVTISWRDTEPKRFTLTTLVRR
jgi:prepilin-type N-terminal cleavage/methylation domain-containing protein